MPDRTQYKASGRGILMVVGEFPQGVLPRYERDKSYVMSNRKRVADNDQIEDSDSIDRVKTYMKKWTSNGNQK